MAWCYEIRGAENRLVEIRYGFATEDEARGAGKRAKRLIDCVCYPNLERLTILTSQRKHDITRFAEMPGAPQEWLEPQTGEGKPELRYPWQQLVLDAFMEPVTERIPLKISIAERAITARLVEHARCEIDERLALAEALLALRRLIGHFVASPEFKESRKAYVA